MLNTDIQASLNAIFAKLELIDSRLVGGTAAKKTAEIQSGVTSTTLKERREEVKRLFNALATMSSDKKGKQCFPASIRGVRVSDDVNAMEVKHIVPVSVLKNRCLMRKCFRLYDGETSTTDIFNAALKSTELVVMTLDAAGIKESNTLCAFTKKEADRYKANASDFVPTMTEEEKAEILAKKASEVKIEYDEKGKPLPVDMDSINLTSILGTSKKSRLDWGPDIDMSESYKDAAPPYEEDEEDDEEEETPKKKTLL